MMGQQVSPHTYGDAVLMSNLFKNPNERCRSFAPLLLKISFFFFCYFKIMGAIFIGFNSKLIQIAYHIRLGRGI